MVWKHWFIPHKDNHKKARLISWEAILIYILFFIFLQVSFSIVGYSKPGVLGISSSVDQKQLIELTNKERQKNGLNPLTENQALDEAAKLKAANMFTENYWAHFAPSGKTPWDFILGSGYKFTFAGENLAKNFYKSDDVVSAWLDSPTHRDNLLNPRYSDIGMAVVEGVLNGQKTTLVVQMFGTTQNLATLPSVNVSGQKLTVPKQEYNEKPMLVAAANISSPQIKSLIDPYQITKVAGISLLSLISVLLLVDLMVLKKRGVFRSTSHHLAHWGLLSVSAAALLSSAGGSIL